MEEAIWIELGALSAATVALAVVWGFLGNGGPRKGWMGALMMGLAASAACGMCLLGFKWGDWRGLLAGVLLVALAGGFLGSKLGKRRGGLFVALLWLGYCASCAAGYRWARGWQGWLTITLPSVALFWYSLWRFSGRILPLQTRRRQWSVSEIIRYVRQCLLHPKRFMLTIIRIVRDTQWCWLPRDLLRNLPRQLRSLSCLRGLVGLFWYALWRLSGRLLPQRKRIRRLGRCLLRTLFRLLRRLSRPLKGKEQRQRRYRYLALRALVTYSMGTNYPYYIVENGELQKRVDGNPFRQFLAGPGLVITKPHQAAVITDGMRIKEIAPPGLTFTGLFDRIGQIVDLRTQLKAFDVEALTEDGIRIRVLTFVFFKIRSPNLPPGRFWADVLSEQEIFDAVRAQPVEDTERRNWDDLVPMVAERILQDIISECRFDELCARDQPPWSPPEEIKREKIKDKFTDQLTKAMAERCRGIQIIGAGIANLEPVDSGVMQQRIETWRTEWTRNMMIQMGEGAAEAMRRIAQARAQGQAEVISILCREAEHMDSVDKDILADVLTLRLLGALEELARRPLVQQLLPPEATETMKYLRREMEKSSSTDIQGQGR